MRIVSLLPSATEIVSALGLGDSIVGVSHECDYPESVSDRPRLTHSILQHGLDPKAVDAAVADASLNGVPIYAVDPEIMKNLAPDLIVTQGVCDVCAVSEPTVFDSLKLLPAAGSEVQVLSLTGMTVEGIIRDITRVGEVTGRPEAARNLVQSMRARWSAVEALPPLPTPPRVLMLEWPDPAWTAGHWVPEVVTVAGGTDVFGVAGGLSERKSWEDVAASDPDVIVSVACGHGLEKNLEFARSLRTHRLMRKVTAVQEGRVYAADANSYFSRPAPRVVRGAELMAYVLGRKNAGIPGDHELVRAW
ncbi:MAG: cobalamin-binding protein [Myxococcota bacterium]|nr:cobalamin-binding protein [Myxococcota bacterium]